MLHGSIFIEDNAAPSRSFKRFISCNLYIGVFDANVKQTVKEPYLCLVTLTRTFKYKINNNVKRIISKELVQGKVCIQFSHPSHSVMIRSNDDKLTNFLRVLKKLLEVSNPVNTPVIPSNLKFISKVAKTASSSNLNSIYSKVTCIPLRSELLKNIHILHLPNSNISNLPIQLGLRQWSEINFENNNLVNNDLLWLEEMPIRKSLNILNLSKNRITSFPSALVDYYNLILLNLRDNCIQHLPGQIGTFQRLRYLYLSNNEITYLPASMIEMRLDEIDLTENYLTCNTSFNTISSERNNFKRIILLEDLAATHIECEFRRQLSIKDCPRRLLEKLRGLSHCICGKQSIPSKMTEYYTLLTSTKFSASYSIHPQKTGRGIVGNDIYLQFHFCQYSNRCESRKFRMIQAPYFRLELK